MYAALSVSLEVKNFSCGPGQAKLCISQNINSVFTTDVMYIGGGGGISSKKYEYKIGPMEVSSWAQIKIN
jgi:hypothetical protein